MKPHPFLVRAAIGLIALASTTAAEKQKSAEVSGYPFWTAPKRGLVPQFIPGLTAVLELTDAQKQALHAAHDEMMNDEGVQAARSFQKGDPNITDTQREQARADVEAAAARMQEKVTAIFTVEQKAMIENINGAYAEAAKQVGATYQEKFGAVKVGPEERARMQRDQRDEVETLFRRMLDEMLTPTQKEVMAAAAAKEQQKDAKAAGKPPAPK